MNFKIHPVFLQHLPSTTRTLLLLFVPWFFTGVGFAQVPPHQLNAPHQFDARIALHTGSEVTPSPAQRRAEGMLRRSISDLVVSYERTSGVARKLHSHSGYLTAGRAGDPLEIALDFMDAQRELLGLHSDDLADYELTDRVFSRVTGATHFYFGQRHEGLPVLGAQLHANINRDGRVLSLNNSFSPGLAQAAKARRQVLGASQAVEAAAHHLGFEVAPAKVLRAAVGPQRVTRLSQPLVSQREITAQLAWLPLPAGQVRLVWNFEIHTLDDRHVYDFTVDAQTGKVWTRFDLVTATTFEGKGSPTYKVYEQPVESPQHTTPVPPTDARSFAVGPADVGASPLGWHSTGGANNYTILRGNNVHAFEDRDGNSQPPSSEPSCGAALSCNFPLNLNADPVNSISAAAANLFYWNNVVHDIQYQYGFDEAAGNFQVNNFGNGGLGNDDVRALVQHTASGGPTCNAFFEFTRDGTRPRMRMYVCDSAVPSRDGSFDNGVIVHEYGHGISSRQVGGPSQHLCLLNPQHGGEGWSDFFALVYTAEPGDLGTDPRGIGSYLFGLPEDGTIRELPYSTDPAINNWTYESIQGQTNQHVRGSRWAQALWEVYWALVDEHGFDSDLYDATAGFGNHRTLLYVNEGLKNTICSPSFLDARDGIIQAVADNFGGEDYCRVWEAFAGFGLGVDATTAGPQTTDVTNGFAIPTSCTNQPPVTVDDVFTGYWNQPLTILWNDLLANDSDPDGDPLQVCGIGNPTVGTINSGKGSSTYTAPYCTHGLVTFEYTACDGQGGSTVGTVEIYLADNVWCPPVE